MAELKTKKNNTDVKKFIESVDHPQKQADAFLLSQNSCKINLKLKTVFFKAY